MIRMTREEIAAYRKKEQAEAMAAESAAVYNLDLIRKLEKRASALEFANVAQAKHIELLTRLVERMGETVKALEECIYPVRNEDISGGIPIYYPYTIIGQREYDAAMHEEG